MARAVTRRFPTQIDTAQRSADGRNRPQLDAHALARAPRSQFTDTDKIFGHKNNFTGGVSDDHGWTHFIGNSQLGMLPPDFVVQGYSGEYINDPAYDISPVDLLTQNTYLGIYVLDDFDITDRLGLHVGARFNDAQINARRSDRHEPDSMPTTISTGSIPSSA